MTQGRWQIYDPKEVGIYHCMSRCVRRAYLCGQDPLSGKSFEHRRGWIKARLEQLSEAFAVEIIAYAVMSNHIHTLIRPRPDITDKWSDREVAIRWISVFSGPKKKKKKLAKKDEGKEKSASEKSSTDKDLEFLQEDSGPSDEDIEVLLSQPAKLEKCRERLSNMSWFNRCVNEFIARSSNAEDDCTGRFWEGRYKCQKITSLKQALVCAAYVDLNPVRAGIAKSLENSRFTSIQDRIRAEKAKKHQQERERVLGQYKPQAVTVLKNEPSLTEEPQANLPAGVESKQEAPRFGPILLDIEVLTDNQLSFRDYLALVEHAGQISREGKAGLSESVIDKLGMSLEEWDHHTYNFEETTHKFRVIGEPEEIEAQAAKVNKKWFCGIGAARANGQKDQ